MTPEAQNIAIAESLGAKWIDNPTVAGPRKLLAFKAASPSDVFALCFNGNQGLIPNYHASLDACAEFEAKLDSCCADERSLWMDHLALACGWPEGLSHAETLFESHYRSIRATSAQRCEAYLRTMNLWQESK